ncbi:hypothetical protein TNCV_4647102 [Trichonephila clavipes]|uniref:Uncharacterized protein n=1 Tax=Trichonephila clavipes TaxID=2585209 RepID=A0A8X6VI47_TRICX|nr:hypothetical protein TNCV_4647102 [Trichonephila clavipes]
MNTPEFKYNVLKKAERSDFIGELVKDRILCEYDLVASEAKYTLYYVNFLNQLPSTEKKHHQDNQVSEAMAERYGSERLIDVLYSLGFAASHVTTLGNWYLLISRQKQARDDANVLIVETAIEELEHHKIAVIVEDIDLLVILTERTQSHQEVFFKKVGKGNVKTQIYSSNVLINIRIIPDSIDQPITVMPLSRKKTPTLVMPHIEDLSWYGIQDCFYSSDAQIEMPIQPIQRMLMQTRQSRTTKM